MHKLTNHLCYLVVSFIIYLPAYSQFRIGIIGTGDASAVLYSSKIDIDQAHATHSDAQKSVFTYSTGVVLPFKVGKKFIIRPGIEYFKKAWEVQANDRGRVSTFKFLRKYDIKYIQIPINLLLTTPLANGKVYIGTGPYMAYAINGSVKVEAKIFDVEFNKVDEPIFTYLVGNSYKPIQFVDHYTINRIDYGVKGIVGFESRMGLFAEAGIDVGIRQISTSYERYDLQLNRNIRDPNSSVKYSVFHMGVGWLFESKRSHAQ